MRNHVLRSCIAALLAGACALVLTGNAFGLEQNDMSLQWGNGAYGGSNTHQWIAASSARMAARHGANWVNIGLMVGKASTPDTVFGDHIDHNYNRWGSYPSYYNSHWGTRFGNPQIKVQRYYNLAVAALKRGDKNTASRMIGLMSHYVADVNEPLHTQESRLETDELHTAYERDVDHLFSSSSSHQDWLHWDGYQYVPNASAFAVAAAIKSHSYYSTLVSSFAHHGFNSQVRSITVTSLNHAVNGLSDLIISAQYDADTVKAIIDSVSPSTATSGQPIAFAGHGQDPHHKIVGWQWRSSIDGVLSTSAKFSTTGLSVGIHTIYLKVRCDHGKWSGEVAVPVVVGASGTHPLPVYRFSNRKTGGYFLTASESEKHTLMTKSAWAWAFEGVAFAVDASSTANSAPLYRFRNLKRAGYFYTANEAWKNSMLLNHSYRFEGVAFNVALSVTGTQPVFRLWNRTTGLGLWTASAAERHALLTKRKTPWRNDGVAFSYAPPW